ncbi:3-deoxy-D-arabinoheptulosonate-7-phosphate synthase [Mycolicibacterium phlei]|jgi:3-deoxy-7-phosphoheptulonate synthase|uniref:Phospho-2-dehydro-3-deoxyheptonate aldolase n=1 Tax=Mycolicibacterium phlei DSM 43239 = CCUG 21000 TaxID=1226750 RepID=A0A5N5V427_MYCPH|nr:3-deoxy-7-phosphoheptulonate synthase [Mycolicibacterium phlei]VEG08388.1 3-deoxy-D-arabinoheptulosonate-7-phosphate synthase [Mycobacteroides chelonae]AMO60268.1 Phospho-2-dehydro-3-deoxyheptonate aldolase, Phe-sensitive [Mycolicibacterium phlei]KAB7756684.1 phospho-2-dehydro-3-deoxyheptonate aldolase [Mycolicibacterium phlei DSM 43239 = CCUG 21000]KXW63572.1 phospho-2-dehydro-3-deoxyheptonate aldolase [Mycolicibacterium phlei DSM 43239 = CCUG 21000]KXW66428.1 phospho-2-dehydro-3-deoxyhept
MNPAQTATPPATSDRRIRSFSEIPSPHQVLAEFPLGARRAERVARDRAEIADILAGRDNRLLVVVGPCSVHDPAAALDYASRLVKVAEELKDTVKIVMRVYFEKPRTTIGWKGLINDPGMDNTFDVSRGLRIARQLLLDIVDIGLPVGCEFLEPTSPQYIADAVAWGAIGARTTESQVHRQLASGLSMPVGFKNGTDGNIQVAVDGVKAAAAEHVFFGMDDLGRGALVSTAGNEDCHVILRGGTDGPNYGRDAVLATAEKLTAAGLPGRVVIDCSHANSGKDHIRQAEVAAEVADMVRDGLPISGVMLESFLVGGAQSPDAKPLTYGQSVTDKCMDWYTTESVLRNLGKPA